MISFWLKAEDLKPQKTGILHLLQLEPFNDYQKSTHCAYIKHFASEQFFFALTPCMKMFLIPELNIFHFSECHVQI